MLQRDASFTSTKVKTGGVAYLAHIGGFLAGLLLFSLFDPVPRAAVHTADVSSPDASARD